MLQRRDEFLPDCAQDAEGEHRAAGDVGREVAEFKGGAAEAAELGAKRVEIERMLRRFSSRLRGNDGAGRAGGGRGGDREGQADGDGRVQIDRLTAEGLFVGKGFAKAEVRCGSSVFHTVWPGLRRPPSKPSRAKVSSTRPLGTGSVSDRQA